MQAGTRRKPIRRKSVTHVFGIICNPCVRNGPEVTFDGEVDPVPLEATSPNQRTWLTMIETGLLSDEDISFTLSTVIPDNPDWVGRTGSIRWVVTVMYPRTSAENTSRFEDKIWETTVQYPIKFLDKAEKG